MTALGELAAQNALAATGTTAPESIDSDVPTIETAAYARSKPRWRKCRDLLFGGIEAIRAGGTFYLPQYEHESDSMYHARRTIAGLFNAFARTVDAVVGLLLGDEPTLDKEMHPKLKEMAENVDRAGTALVVFAKDLVENAVCDGIAGILTEYPRLDDPSLDLSKASAAAVIAIRAGEPLDASDEAALDLRPYFIRVKADEVKPEYETVNGKKTLVRLTRLENSTERKDRFGNRSVTRYCVYELKGNTVTFERWKCPEGSTVPVLEKPATPMHNITGIPWSPLALGKKLGDNEYKPTMMDLCEKNLEHHRIQTGRLSLQELAFVPTQVVIGRQPKADGTYEPIIRGPGNTIEVPVMEGMPEKPVYWDAPDTAVLDAADRSLEDCKAEMGAMGASFLTPQKVQETATAKRIDAAADQATVSSMSQATTDCLESAFGFAAQYLGVKSGSITLSDKFTGEGISNEFLQILMQAYQEDAIELEDFRHALKTGQLPEGFDPSDTLQLLARKAAKQRSQQLEEEERQDDVKKLGGKAA